ncbi:6047_t:CDS:1 [Diversispora eburnea]|uniref:6047_t:CDS:1 n=2 Tax=Diversisporales TaxID=214509 RepID=A0A9N9AP56_9GLOM|nr:8962_t:CDS:1 [Dentiscutata erythropus]CAG8537787.1 6047_t:CDS:1 [Diversispora eburnea]
MVFSSNWGSIHSYISRERNKTSCQKFGVSASLSIVQAINAIIIAITIAIFWIAIQAQASQVQSRLVSIGGGIPLKDLASWISINSPLGLFKAYKSGSLRLWIVLAGLVATTLNAGSRQTYTVGNVSSGFHTVVTNTVPEQNLQGMVCGANCISVSPYILSSRFDSLASSNNITTDPYNASDGFTIYLPPPSFYGTGTTIINRRGVIGDKIECWQQSELPSTIYVSESMLKDRYFHETGSQTFVIAIDVSSNYTGGITWTAVLYLNKNSTKPEESVDGYYTVCNATSKIYDITARASFNNKWEKSSIIMNLDSRLVFTEGNYLSDGSINPYTPSDCTNCDFVGNENGNITMALVFGSKIEALLSFPLDYANIGFDGKGYPLPSHTWLGYNYSRFFQSPDDVSRAIDSLKNRFIVALSEVNKVSDGMNIGLQIEGTYSCVVNRWPVIYLLLALSGLIGLIGCYYTISMKSKLIDIGPKSLLALGTTYETQQILRSTSVLGEENIAAFNSDKVCLIDIEHQNVNWSTLSFTDVEKAKVRVKKSS